MTQTSESWEDPGRAKDYARWSAISVWLVHRPFAKRISKSLSPLGPVATIVDLGVGPGLLAVELHRLWPAAQIVGVDPSTQMLQIAQQNAARAGMPGFQAKPGRAEEIPLESGSADLVVSESSFHEWQDQRAGLAEILRVLRVGGSVVLKDFDLAWLSPWKCKLLELVHPLGMFRFSLDEAVGLVRDEGFTVTKADGGGMSYLLFATKRKP